ncbi:hypothetical protein LSAT2_023906 [Lamellibrachia satsuma]|nr:hypothetical protein LSAT2_023906 [Lamellibrachia satsuma]
MYGYISIRGVFKGISKGHTLRDVEVDLQQFPLELCRDAITRPAHSHLCVNVIGGVPEKTDVILSWHQWQFVQRIGRVQSATDHTVYAVRHRTLANCEIHQV